MTLNKLFNIGLLVALLVACKPPPPTPQVDINKGTPPPTATEHPLHVPVQAPTSERDFVQVPARWDANGDGVVNIDDIDIMAGDMAAATSWLKMHGGSVSVTVGAK
jgi:hypothetical protein